MLTKHKKTGFTLIELLTVIAVIAIAMALAAPSMASFVRANRTAGEINTLSAAIRMAKTEAIKRGSAVQICASTDGSSCSGVADWATGWIIYEDLNKNQTLDNNESIIMREQSFKTGDSLLASSNTSAININSDGFLYKLPATGFVLFTLKTNPIDDWAQRCLRIDIVADGVVYKKGEGGCV